VVEPESKPSQASVPEVFSVPRRFDLATVLVAMLAYAVLFAVLHAPGVPRGVIGFVGLFFAVVAVGQAVAIRWQSPRLASMLAATLFWLVVGGVALGTRGGGCEACGVGMMAAVVGPITGYLGGALVGGVFLVSHYLRESKWLGRQSADSTLGEPASPWSDDLEPTDHSAPSAR
jgi:hypothetical protein